MTFQSRVIIIIDFLFLFHIFGLFFLDFLLELGFFDKLK